MKTLLPLFILLCVSTLPAAATDGAVHGRVYGQDEKGGNLGPLAGATIELKSEAGGAVATATTNNFGYYQIATLAPGAYRYKVAAAGYKVEDAQRGFAMPQDTREFVHDFLLSREPKPGAPGPAQSQLVQPAVHGRVYGQSEKGENLGPIPGAKVELLTGQGGAVVATATANSPGGYYEIKNLPAADYAYRVTAAGFATEDAGRGFTVPQATLEYVHDFLLSKTPPKRFNCDVPILVVKRLSSGTDGRKSVNDVRLPVANAKIVLQPITHQQTPLNQPFVTDARGEHTGKGLPEGGFTVAIDAPECEPFIGTLQIVCGEKNNEQVIFELQPCNELLHGYVRALLSEGWGPSAQATGASDRAYQRAVKAGGAKDCRVSYALALAQLSAGKYEEGQANLAAAIGQKSDDPAWDRACETRLWMHLSQHQPEQAVKEIRSLVKNHYGTRPATPAAKDTARLCGVALGLIKGPWKDMVSPADAALLESDMAGLKGELQTESHKGRDHVAAEHGKLKGALDDALNRLLTELTTKRNAEIAGMVERQSVIGTTVTALDKDLMDLQATVNQCNEQFRVQILGFTQQREALVPQMTALNRRLQQISACMARDQQNYQGELMRQRQMQQQQVQQQQEMLRRQQEEMMRRQQQEMMRRQQQQSTPPTTQLRQQSPQRVYQPSLAQQAQVTTQPGIPQTGVTTPPGMQGGGGLNTQAIQAEIQQHQVEIQQVQAQMGLLQRQDAQFAAQITNLQNQYVACTGNAQTTLVAKVRERERLAKEYEDLDRKRTTPFDPTDSSTPEIDRLKKEDLTLRTYCDLPLDNRREELLDQFDCGAAKEPQRPAGRGQGQGSTPTRIQEPDFPKNTLMRMNSAPKPTAVPVQQQSMRTSALPAAPAMSSAPALNTLDKTPALAPAPTPAPAPKPAFVPEPAPPPVPAGSSNELGLPPSSRRALPPTTVRPPPAVGDAAEVVVSNNLSGTMRLFGIAPGGDNEQFVRSLQPGEEAMIPVKVGQILIIRAATGGQELQRQTISKKLEVLKLGGQRQE